MEKDQLSRFFNTDLEDAEIQSAYSELRVASRVMAEVINKLVPESPSNGDILGRLFRVGVDSELAIRMDGVNRTISPIVMKH